MSTESEKYEYIRAAVDDGDLSITYRLVGSKTTGRLAHDEDVTDWTDREIKDLIVCMLDVSLDQRDMIEFDWA